ncbi:MAG: hypothetical protein JXC35_02735 [Acholeplasmataceae bacterium]|nr:hypothetical protein [Acholeplasmataceae bacterium]
MKKALFYSLIIIFFSVIGYLIYLDQNEVSPKVLTIETAYVMMDDEPTLEIPLYINETDHPLKVLDAVEHVSLVSLDSETNILVELINVSYQGSEFYLNQTFDMYLYQLNLPSFDQTFILENAMMAIDLKNGTSYAFTIGKISISPSKPIDYHLNWSKLSGTKMDQSIYERIGCVEIGIFELNKDIVSFFDGFTYSEVFQIKDDVLYLYLNDEPFIYQSFPIEIIFSDGTSQQIPYFNYMNSYHLLKMSGPLIHVYDLNPFI